jgi:hypothetical protein
MSEKSLHIKAVSLAKDIAEAYESNDEITRLLALIQQLLLIRQALPYNPSS